MALKRRSFVEQRVVRLLRLFADRQLAGAALDAEIMRLGFTPTAVRRFGPLAKLSGGLGYEFKPLLSPFVSAGELRLIGLLAQAQRVNVDLPVAVGGELRDMLVGCAAALDTIGIRLPPLAMVSVQLPEPDAVKVALAALGRRRGATHPLVQAARRSSSSAWGASD